MVAIFGTFGVIHPPVAGSQVYVAAKPQLAQICLEASTGPAPTTVCLVTTYGFGSGWEESGPICVYITLHLGALDGGHVATATEPRLMIGHEASITVYYIIERRGRGNSGCHARTLGHEMMHDLVRIDHVCKLHRSQRQRKQHREN